MRPDEVDAAELAEFERKQEAAHKEAQKRLMRKVGGSPDLPFWTRWARGRLVGIRSWHQGAPNSSWGP